MRQLRRNSCRPFGTSDASSSRTTGSRPWLHLVVPPGLNHIPGNHVDYVLPMFSLIKILHGVALPGGEGTSLKLPYASTKDEPKSAQVFRSASSVTAVWSNNRLKAAFVLLMFSRQALMKGTRHEQDVKRRTANTVNGGSHFRKNRSGRVQRTQCGGNH